MKNLYNPDSATPSWAKADKSGLIARAGEKYNFMSQDYGIKVDGDKKHYRLGQLSMVFDGVGGNRGGREISQFVGQKVELFFKENQYRIINAKDIKEIDAFTQELARVAQNAGIEFGEKYPQFKDAATTMAGFFIHPFGVTPVGCGDSVVGMLFPNGAHQELLIRDSYVAQQIQAGVLSKADAGMSAHRNIVTQTINAHGINNNVSFGHYKSNLRDLVNYTFYATSDGTIDVNHPDYQGLEFKQSGIIRLIKQEIKSKGSEILKFLQNHDDATIAISTIESPNDKRDLLKKYWPYLFPLVAAVLAAGVIAVSDTGHNTGPNKPIPTSTPRPVPTIVIKSIDTITTPEPIKTPDSKPTLKAPIPTVTLIPPSTPTRPKK